MEKISHTEYTFEHWLKGHPEPDSRWWGIISDESGMKQNPVYMEILEAKNYAFETSLRLYLKTKKESLNYFISKVDIAEKIDYTQAELDLAKNIFSKYPIQELVRQTNQDKLKGIDGKKYLTIRDQDEGMNSRKYIKVMGEPLNAFHSAVIHYQYSKYCHQLLSEEFKPENSEKSEKSESLAVRYKLLDEFFNGNENFNKLRTKDKERLFGFILGCHQDSAKHIKNQWVKYNSTKNPDGKDITPKAIDRFTDLSNKIKKGEF